MKNNIFLSAVICVAFLGNIAPALAFSKDGDEVKRSKCSKGDFSRGRNLRASVEEVVDGDTLKIVAGKSHYNVRILSVDTPETHYNGKSQGYWGERAHNYLASLLSVGDRVEIEFDREGCDAYGRLLGYVWKGKTLINKEILKAGLAVNYCIYPNDKYCRDFARVVEPLEREARQGIWGDPSVDVPYEWRVKIDGRQFTKFVGNMFEREIHQPHFIDRIPVADRIFFFTREDIQAPYWYAD